MTAMAAMAPAVHAEDAKPATPVISADDLKKALGMSIYLQGWFPGVPAQVFQGLGVLRHEPLPHDVLLALGQVLGLDRDLRRLLGVGTAICGGSAIAAVSSVIEADQADIAYALGAVFLSGALFVALTLAGVIKKVVAAIPTELYSAIAAGIGGLGAAARALRLRRSEPAH